MGHHKAWDFIKPILIVFVLSSLCACATFDPKVLPGNRQDFNIALLRSDREQLLLNLVRMQFAEQPYFLGVATVSSQLRF